MPSDNSVPASAVGAPHRRDRVWIVTHANSEHGRPGTGREDGPQTRHGSEPWRVAGDAADPARQQVGLAGQPWFGGSVEPSASDAQGVGQRPRRQGRPPDSFARVRDEARRNAADPYGARLAFREGLSRDAWEERPAAQRGPDLVERTTVWPDEPALSGVDDGNADWMDRVRATGNQIVPQVATLIALTF